MDVSVWQVLIYLAPTVAHSDEAVRAECLPRVQGEHYISHYLRTIGHFLLAAGQRGWSGAAKLQEGSTDCRRGLASEGGELYEVDELLCRWFQSGCKLTCQLEWARTAAECVSGRIWTETRVHKFAAKGPRWPTPWLYGWQCQVCQSTTLRMTCLLYNCWINCHFIWSRHPRYPEDKWSSGLRCSPDSCSLQDELQSLWWSYNFSSSAIIRSEFLFDQNNYKTNDIPISLQLYFVFSVI